MLIKVLQEDIDKSKEISGARNECCPIACAIKRTLNTNKYFFVTNQNVHFLDSAVVPLPKIATDFIFKADFGVEKIEPFDFELDIK